MNMIKRVTDLESKHFKIFGYQIVTPEDILFGTTEILNNYLNALEKSIKDKKDYIIGNFGITEESVRLFNRPAEKIIWD